MRIEPLALPGVHLVTFDRIGDARGWFMEAFSRARFEAAGIEFAPVQENQSLTQARGAVRGLHFQRAPHEQAKFVRVLKGSIFDVAVDIRPGSETFGQWVGETLSAEAGTALFIPRGYAHGFCTLEPDCEIAYLIDNPYAAECDAAIRWNDPAIGVAWPEGAGTVLSERDAAAPLLAEVLAGGFLDRG